MSTQANMSRRRRRITSLDKRTSMGDCIFAFKDKDMAPMLNKTVYTYD